MSKERLEEIKKRLVLLHNAIDVDDETKNYIFKDLKVEWLIERVQELEETNKKNYWIASDFKFENLVLEQQNKRYREAREIIEQEYKEHNVGVVYGYEDGYLDGLDTAIGIIDKALEGEE